MYSRAGWYTTAQTCVLFRLENAKAPAELHSKGLLPSKKNAAGRLYAKDWVDALAALLVNYPSMHSRDERLFELYALNREYHSHADASPDQRKRLRAKVKRKCEQLCADGKVWKLQQLAEVLELSEDRVRAWAHRGKLSALRFGNTWYLTARYAKYVVRVYTRWKTTHELAEEWNVPYDVLVEGWIGRGELPAVKFADGMYRIDPEVFRAHMAAYTGVTLQEAARRIGCDKSTLTQQVHSGTVASTGWRYSRRIPEQEVAKWEELFNNLNADFAWLQPIVAQPGQAVQTLTSRQTQRALKASPAHLTLMSQEGLLPYFPRSFVVRERVIRIYVRRYIIGLAAYVGGGTATRRQAAAYKALCKERGNIV